MGEGAGAGVGPGAVRLVGLRYGVDPFGVEGTRRFELSGFGLWGLRARGGG